MSVRGRSYRYVGPVELKAAVRLGSDGCPISSAAEGVVRQPRPDRRLRKRDGLGRTEPAPRNSAMITRDETK
ncbi:hypothetical protein EAO73_28230 [Streptomyces sp. col6]|nr:hypothetical protein EAO73_28230 [Streptomyces sp. col6]